MSPTSDSLPSRIDSLKIALRGHKKRISPHLARGPSESVDEALKEFYDRLLAVLRQPIVRESQWQLLECRRCLGRELDERLLAGFRLARSEGRGVVVAVCFWIWLPGRPPCFPWRSSS